MWKASPHSKFEGRGCPSCIYRTPNFEGDGVSPEEADAIYDKLSFDVPAGAWDDVEE